MLPVSVRAQSFVFTFRQYTVADPRFPRHGEPTPNVGVPIYYLAKFFSQKLHDNERHWAEGNVPGAP